MIRRLLNAWRGRHVLADLDEEIETHRQMTERRLRDSGVLPGPAASESRRIMGNATLALEDARRVWIATWVDAARQDVRYALRNLWRTPGFTLLVLATLGVGIGVNTSLFTVINACFLRPWPVADPSRVLELTMVPDGMTQADPENFSLREYRHLRDHTRSLSSLIASTCADDREPGCRVKLDGQTIGVLFVSHNYFDMLGIGMERGPGFAGPENGREDIAVISYELWQQHFSGDATIVGRAVRLNDAQLTVVGVASRDFRGTSFGRKDLWLPFGARTLVHPHAPDLDVVRMAGRLAPTISRQQAAAELESLSRRYRSDLASPGAPSNRLLQQGRISLTPTSFNPNPGKSHGAYVLFGLLTLGTLLILILACANVGNLLLARSVARRRELAVRVSLGAGRLRVLRQLLTESLMLAILAALVGGAMTYVIPPMFVRWIYGQFGALGTPPFSSAPDGSVVAWTLILISGTCVCFGLAPAMHAARQSVSVGLKPTSSDGSRLRLRSVLLAVQVVVSIVLLASASLLVRSVRHAAAIDLGFVADDVMFLSFDLPPSFDANRRSVLARQIVDATTDLVDKKSIALATTVPFGRQSGQVRFVTPDSNEPARIADAPLVSAGYFDVLSIPMIAGRSFEPADRGRDVVIVEEGLAVSLWPGQSPLGRILLIEGRPSEIVGVVKNADTTGRRLRGSSAARAPVARSGGQFVASMIYRRLDESVFANGSLPEILARTTPASATNLGAELERVDGRIDVQVHSLKDSIDRKFAPSRMGAVVAGILAVLALTFASIGVFGVFAYIVQQRTREIGVRMALGAQPSQVIGFVVRSSSPALLIGLLLGFAGAIAGSRMIQSSLIGISALDPVAYGAVVGILACAAVVAVLVPASRAARVDPVTALRCE